MTKASSTKQEYEGLREKLVCLARLYCEYKDISLATVSTSVMNGGGVLDRLAKGETDLLTRNFERAVRWFDSHWPADLPWPEGLQRPSLIPSTEEAA